MPWDDYSPILEYLENDLATDRLHEYIYTDPDLKLDDSKLNDSTCKKRNVYVYPTRDIQVTIMRCSWWLETSESFSNTEYDWRQMQSCVVYARGWGRQEFPSENMNLMRDKYAINIAHYERWSIWWYVDWCKLGAPLLIQTFRFGYYFTLSSTLLKKEKALYIRNICEILYLSIVCR